jgi:hypothetical protein
MRIALEVRDRIRKFAKQVNPGFADHEDRGAAGTQAGAQRLRRIHGQRTRTPCPRSFVDEPQRRHDRFGHEREQYVTV